MKALNVISCGVFDSSAVFTGKETRERQTERFELDFIISSNGASFVNGKRHELRPGTVIFAKPGATRKSILHFKCYYIHFESDEASEFYGPLCSVPDCLRIIDPNKFQQIFEELITHSASNEPYSEWFISAKLCELFYLLCRGATINTDDRRETSEAINLAVKYIDENYGGDVSLSALSRLTGYSPNYLHSLFTRIMGVTPQKYILSVRILNAKKQLAVTDKSLAEIAYDCGFSSQSYFNMQFKAATLLTPKEYRKVNSSAYPT